MRQVWEYISDALPFEDRVLVGMKFSAPASCEEGATHQVKEAARNKRATRYMSVKN